MKLLVPATTVALSLFSCNQNAKTASDVTDISDTASVTQNADGTFHVVCQDGSVEANATRARVLGNVCEAAPDPVESEYELDIDSYWQTNDQEGNKKYLAVLNADRFNAHDSMVIYGKSRGAASARSFYVESFPGREGANASAQDDFYRVVVKANSREEVEVTMEGRGPNYHYQMTYSKIPADQVPEEAQTMLKVGVTDIYKRFDVIAGITEPETIYDLKKLIDLHRRTFSYGGPERWATDVAAGIEYQLESFWLQIETYLDFSTADRELANAAISGNGSDAITRRFKSEGEWTAWNELPEPEVAIEDARDEDGDVRDMPDYYQYTATEVPGLLEGNIKKGVEKFLKYTVVTSRPFECEGGYDWIPGFDYILSDGSVFSYDIGEECD
jgi:hypothetical protein